MCETCNSLRHEIYKLRDENLILNRRIGLLNLELDAAKAQTQELKFWTVEQVAELLQMSQPTIFKYINNGEIIAMKPEKGRSTRIKHSDLVDFIVRNTAKKLEVCEC